MSDKDCLFCKIMQEKFQAKKCIEDDTTYAFKDIKSESQK